MHLSHLHSSRGRALLTALLLLAAMSAAGALGWYLGHHGTAATAPIGTGRKTLFYQSPMHPWIKSDHAGNCTICGMKLVPVYEGESGFDDKGARPPGITLSSETSSVVHVATATVQRQALRRSIRVAGTIEDDDTAHRKLSAYVDGRIDKLFVNYVGAEVMAGQPLAALYSRDLLVARSEYTLARRMSASPERDSAISASRQKLRRMGLTLEQIEALPGQTGDTFEIVAPQGGTVVSRNVYEGQYVKEGDVLFEIGNFARMWFVFDAYERDLTWVRRGQSVEITTPSQPGQRYQAPIEFIDPNLNPATRSAKVRVVLDNPLDGHRRTLLHKVYAEGRIAVESEPVLTVPREAVLSADSSPLVYVASEGNRYEARHVILGRAGDETWEVLSGLQEGDRVVTTGNLLIDAQAQLDGGERPPSEVATVVPSFSEVQRSATRSFLESISQTAAALASDDLSGFQRSLAALNRDAQRVAEVLGVRGERLRKLLPLAKSADVAAARTAFYPVSTIAADLGLELRKSAPDFAGLKVYECPMAKSAVPTAETNAGRWVQWAGPMRNPFFGSEMINCGEEVLP